jgi:polyisoprenoid-binding protein YceI
MKINAMAGSLLTTLAIVGWAWGPGATAQAGDSYAIDKVHSSVGFKVKHKEVGYVHGRFNDFAGKIDLDPAKPANSSVQITVQAASVDTAFEKRDQHLKSPDFFNAKQFPTITFQSKQVKVTGKETADVTGELTLLGVTKPVTAKVTHVGSADKLIGFEARFQLKRSDYGMKFMVGPLGDAIELVVSVEAAKP